jgi:hypothetical protein
MMDKMYTCPTMRVLLMVDRETGAITAEVTADVIHSYSDALTLAR